MPTKVKGKDKSKKKKKGHKDRFFNITVKLLPTSEIFTLTKIHNDMKMEEIKSSGEFTIGIPKTLQKLTYLDQGSYIYCKHICAILKAKYVPPCASKSQLFYL